MTILDLIASVPSHIRLLAAYQPGKPIDELERELGLTSIVKLASNENPLGPSPRALAALRDSRESLSLYPDGNGFALRSALSRHFAVSHEQIVLGNGSNDILELVARTFLGPQTSAVFSQYGFAIYSLVTQASGAAGISVPARDYGHDLDALLAAIRSDTRVVYIANPNNPTGTFLEGARLTRFLERVPERVLVVLDEAYTEYLPLEDRYDSIAWLDRYPNLLISRTFSKAYGLAGLRIGFGLGNPAVIDLLNRVRQPFNVNAPALIAAAAALTDRDFLERSWALNRDGLAQLGTACQGLGLDFLPSRGNFLAIPVENGTQVFQALLQQGVIVRPLAGYDMPRFIRVTVGRPDENQRFIEALARVLDRPFSAP